MSAPRFTILDALSRGGSASRPNDDAYGSGRRGVFVIDGATGLGEPLLPGESDAQWVALEGAALLASRMDDPALSHQGLIAATIGDLTQRFSARRARAPQETYEVPFASFVMLRAAAGAAPETVSFGDCTLILESPNGDIAVIGPPEKARGAERARAHAAGAAHTKPREAVLPELRRYRNAVNSRPGYGLLGPDARAVPLLKTAALPFAPPFTALLMSDGFFALASDYYRYAPKGLIQTARTRGLDVLYRELRDIEAGDPMGALFPRFKTSDDATAVLAEVG